MRRRLETDLVRIEILAEERNDKNWKFRTFLKNRDEEETDSIVHRLVREVNAEIDCTKCGNCCRVLQTSLTDPDVERLCARLAIARSEFLAQFTVPDSGGQPVLDAPCPFLEASRCALYYDRPEVCRDYPHIQKEGFVFRLMSVISNCAVCPIVFNVYERLKQEYNFR